YFFTFGLGVKGLALGHATAYTFAAVAAAVLMRRKLGGLEGRVVLRGIAKVLVGGGMTAIASFGASRALAAAVDTRTVIGQVTQVTGSIAIGLLVFVAAALLLRMEDLQLVKEFVVPKVRLRRGARP